jgi:hypothetical protein
MKRIKRLARNMLWNQLIQSEQFLPMRFFMLLGGFIGFAVVMLTGLMAGTDPWMVLLHASVGCLAGAFLFKIFRMVVSSSVRQVVLQKARTQATEPPRSLPAAGQ